MKVGPGVRIGGKCPSDLRPPAEDAVNAELSDTLPSPSGTWVGSLTYFLAECGRGTEGLSELLDGGLSAIR